MLPTLPKRCPECHSMQDKTPLHNPRCSQLDIESARYWLKKTWDWSEHLSKRISHYLAISQPKGES